MIISRTPYRISFFGGGTDYPIWFEHYKGAVLGATIDKYCYLTCRYLPPFFIEHKHRIVWSVIELVNTIAEIRHPAVRELLKYTGASKGVEIHHMGDLPARTGLGSSSAFTVGLLNVLYALKGREVSQRELALDAIHAEQNLIKDNVGCQDQILTAVGGMNHIEFKADGQHLIQRIKPPARLHKYLMLFFSGFQRTASHIVKEQIRRTPERYRELTRIYEMVDRGIQILKENDMQAFGELLDESWQIKRKLSPLITDAYIDYVYKTAKDAGAIGGKLLGAGGGGFFLFCVEPKKQFAVKRALSGLINVPFKFENEGSRIIFKEG